VGFLGYIMGRVSDIIERARDTLAEKTPKRWPTARLLRALSEAQKKIAQEILCVREQGTIELCSGYHTYKLDATNIVAEGGRPIAISAIINHAGQNARFVTTNVITEENEDWRTEIGNDVTHIIYNKQKPSVFRVYPIPTTSEITETGATFNTTNEPIADAAIICQPISTESNFDITAELTPIKLQIEFFHIPPPITTVADTNLLIPEEFDIALKHYVVGMTLRDDLDAQNRAFGVEELQLFQSQFDFAKDLTDKNFTDQKEEHYASVGYNAEIK
jgi:hypothetical protein